ncbi:MAG: hypothetical protein QOD91_2310 [Frankiales bacterium]|jgi:predicted dehydrogenase|nr:hypothetical protein [Frankiales bacterium]
MRFGVVGTGYWARTVHAPALGAHRDAVLRGVWGRDGTKSATLADELGVAAYPTLEAMLDDVEAVAIAVPPEVQATIAVTAARQGKHLLLDKPLALSTAAADQVVAAVADSGVRSLVFFTQRFSDNIARWLGSCQGQDEWLSAHVRNFGAIYEPGNPFGESPWRRACGPLWDIAPHALSLVLPLLGPADRVFAERGVNDAVDLVVHHSAGGTSTLSLSLDSPAGSIGSYAQFFGRAGQSLTPEATVTPLQAMGECISQLVAPMGAGRWRHPCDVRFGRDVVAVLEAAQRSLDTGHRQPVSGV